MTRFRHFAQISAPTLVAELAVVEAAHQTVAAPTQAAQAPALATHQTPSFRHRPHPRALFV